MAEEKIGLKFKEYLEANGKVSDNGDETALTESAFKNFCKAEGITDELYKKFKTVDEEIVAGATRYNAAKIEEAVKLGRKDKASDEELMKLSHAVRITDFRGPRAISLKAHTVTTNPNDRNITYDKWAAFRDTQKLSRTCPKSALTEIEECIMGLFDKKK